MYGQHHTSASRMRQRTPANMLLKNLPGLPWLLFGLLSIGYFLFTIHMLSYTQEGCPKTVTTQKLPGPAFRDSGELKLNVLNPHRRASDEEDDDAKMVAKAAKLAPLGKVMIQSPPAKQQTTVSLFNPDAMSAKSLLHSDVTPNIVYMVWCGRRWFEFNNYMSVLSVIKHLKPDNVVFYYDQYPVMDYWLYNTWIDEIKQMYPFFHTEELSAKSYGCAEAGLPNISFVTNLLSATGGMYLNEFTILAKYPFKLRQYDYVYALDNTNMRGFISAKRGLLQKYSATGLLRIQRINSTQVSCVSVNAYNEAKNVPVCVSSKRIFYPKDIWEDPADFSRLIRSLFYGSPAPIDAKPSYDELIPNIAHVVWLGGGRMDYLFYLGVLSLLYVAEVEVVYIHGNAPPGGDLWDKIKYHPRVKLIYRDTPKTVYGQRVKVLSHVTDIWRVDFMIRYGGIYVDTDTVWVKKLDLEIRGYDAVGSYDWTYWNPPFPDTINFGVAIGKRNAPYWHKFQKTMKWFIDDDWSWNGLRQPYKVKERHPDLVRIDPHLQVICYQYLCHPTWWPDYHNESIHHMNTPSIRNWRNDTYAFHWTLPTPPELDDEELLLTSQTMAAEVGRNVLEKAGLLKQLREKYSNNRKAKPFVKGHEGQQEQSDFKPSR